MKTASATQRPDRALLRNTLMRLTMPQKLLSIVVTLVVALIWWPLLQRLVRFGDSIDYSGLHALGSDGLSFIQHYGTYVWWFAGLLCTLLIIYMLYNFVVFTYRLWQQRAVSESTLNTLIPQLSPDACEVIHWTWSERRNPITIGDLQRASHELGCGRFEKIRLAERQATLLNTHRNAKTVPTNDLQSPEFHV